MRSSLLFIFGVFIPHLANASRAENHCDCQVGWAVCKIGYGEQGEKGCGGGKSCAEHCGGNFKWKPLYRKSVEDTIAIQNECKGDPTAKWGNMDAGTNGPYAIAFAGGLRNFVATWHSWKVNLVEESGGNIHTYFHVWQDEHTHASSPITQRGVDLARNLPSTKGFVMEPYEDFLKLLHRDEPDFNGVVGTNESWLSPLAKAFPPGSPKMSPYTFGPGYSQFRKVYLAMQLIKNTGIKYSMIIRARPDHMLVVPTDLRQVALDYSQRPSVINARGHFLAVPERHQGQLLSDHFAMGTQDAMFAYGSKPLPYTTACCEGYVHRNLDLRCFYRNRQIWEEEFTSVEEVENAFRDNPIKDGAGYSVVPEYLRRSPYSPIVNMPILFSPFGSDFCVQNENDKVKNRCIPTFKSNMVYIYNIVTPAWMRAGVMCIGRYAQKPEADFLIFSGIANRTDELAAKKFGFGPCMVVPSLEKAWRETKRYLASLEDMRRKKLADELERMH